MNSFKNIMILGLGLIGGSMALALKNSGFPGKIIGFDLDRENLYGALGASAIDIAAETLPAALGYPGLVIVAIPLGAYPETFQAMARIIGDQEMVVTDVGSVKTHIHDLACQHLPPTVPFIGGHPMSGSEKGGFPAATPYLFENAYYFLTPAKQENQPVMAALMEVIQSMGALPVLISPAEHDRIVAQISHAPHVLASLLANTLAGNDSLRHSAFVGGGFRDTTRIASGNPDLWKDILIYNKREVLLALQTIENILAEVKDIVREQDQAKLLEFFQRAKLIRDGLPKHGKDYLPVLYNIIVDVQDRPGIIGQLTKIVGDHHLNIREIEILHVRDNARGALRIGFTTAKEQSFATQLLAAQNFVVTCV
ncbi:prephenate dehydrogenase [Desulfotomaculum sp. 1211_IL3151]|uniref:prephenate dehydrogenase n=1 Tax=Desulfotomaculum sp. 1211_IL3151 TaxID=3084055 RepID=UPI002FD9EB21